MKNKLTKKQIEIEKLIKDINSILDQYKKEKQNYHIKNKYISVVNKESIIIDNEYLDYLFE